jgi:integrase
MTTTAALADEPGRQKPSRSKSTPKLRDGVMKRGRSWSYVIRVSDPSTGASKPKWVGGFQTEEAAKAARDEARMHGAGSTSTGLYRPSRTTWPNGWKRMLPL